MKGTLHISRDKDENITWSIHLGYGVSVDKYNSFELVVNAIKSAKRVAKLMGIVIQETEYHDFDGTLFKLKG